MRVARFSAHFAFVMAVWGLAISPTWASIQSASSSGFGLSVDVGALGINLDVGPLPTGVAGTAPAPYTSSNSVANVNVTTSIPLVVSGLVAANVINASANSNVDGLPGMRFASASGGVVGAGINAVTLPIIGNGITLLGLNGTLSSTASITGSDSILSAIGTTTIESLGLTIGGIGVDLSAYVNASVAPNTQINLAALGILDATLILNEQIIAPDNSSIMVNALRLSLNALSVGGEIILGHSQVQMAGVSNVPEPSTLAIFLFGIVGFAACKRN